MSSLKSIERVVISVVSGAGGTLDSRKESAKRLLVHEASNRGVLRPGPRAPLLRDAAKARHELAIRGIFLPTEASGKGFWILDLDGMVTSKCARKKGDLNALSERQVGLQAKKIVDGLKADIVRMAATAMHTIAHANGQAILRTVKEKNSDMAEEEIGNEILCLMIEQSFRCKLTGFDFSSGSSNKYLKPSLDRIDSSRGYLRGNLQIITRAANFLKSTGGSQDWSEKAAAMCEMVHAMKTGMQDSGYEPTPPTSRN